MGRNLDKIINSLPAKRQTKIAAISKQKVEEMITQAATLSDFRNAVEKTRAEAAHLVRIVATTNRKTDTKTVPSEQMLISNRSTLSTTKKDSVAPSKRAKVFRKT